MKESQKERTIEFLDREIIFDPGETWIYFSSGAEGPQEEGRYHFWTLSGQDEYGPWTITGRKKFEGKLDPIERFVRIVDERTTSDSVEDRLHYSALYHRFPTAQRVSPATYRAVSMWMHDHKTDAIFACPGWVCRDMEIFGEPPMVLV